MTTLKSAFGALLPRYRGEMVPRMVVLMGGSHRAFAQFLRTSWVWLGFEFAVRERPAGEAEARVLKDDVPRCVALCRCTEAAAQGQFCSLHGEGCCYGLDGETGARCTARACFGIDKAVYCGLHAKDWMHRVDVHQ